MEWLNKFILNNPLLSLLYPTVLSGINFLGNLAAAMSDGEIDAKEFHQLMSSASLLQVLVLILVIIALKIRKAEKKEPEENNEGE